MNLYEILIELSKKYARFYEFVGLEKKRKRIYGSTSSLAFDLENKSIYTGKYYIMKEGELVRECIRLTDGSLYTLDRHNLIHSMDDVYGKIEELFCDFYFSVPSINDKTHKKNFKTIDTKDMTMEQINSGTPRCEARYALDAFVLLLSITGNIPWTNRECFYWQSPNYKQLVLFRSWVENKNKKKEREG